MAATVNASTSAGVVITPDNSGVLALQSSSTTALTIDASQNSTFVGTASATKLIPTGSSATGNGLYLPAANSLGLSTNGTNAVYIDSSQKVGIGTSSPANTLDVQATTAKVGVTSTTGTNTTFYSTNNTGGSFYFGLDNSAGTEFGTAYAGAIYRSGAYPINFYTNAAERMRIDSSGNLLVGATSPSVTSSLQVKRSGGNPVAVHNNGGTSGYFNQILFLNNAGTADIGYIARTNDNSVAYNTTSDYRLKENIAPMTGALATVQLLKPVTYKWKSDGSEGQGFIAHELKAVVPDCVTGAKDAVDADGKPVHQGIDTSFLVATLTAAIQEQQALITAQAATITALTARIVALENK